ncbi:MAG TPA: lytic transglycosylase domain-containing protein [Roseiarcus sp.]|nr:lytic transglycosylase domain-containing protein [Roseiarcus sp.]
MTRGKRLLATLAFAVALAAASSARAGESVIGAICGLIDSSARAQGLPVAFLTRLIWQESNFESNAVSPAGARGVAQFMPVTAGARGLANPFDPESAIPKAAALLAELRNQFGNLGLAAAAYNAGPARLARFIAGEADLPIETQDYVSIITRHSVQEWRGKDAAKLTDEAVFPAASCVQIVAKFRRAEPTLFAHSQFWAPWGVQIAGSFNKAAALRQYSRAEAAYAAVLGGVRPMVLAGRLMSRGYRPYYRVRAPAQTRREAERLCAKLQKIGGACVVLRST